MSNTTTVITTTHKGSASSRTANPTDVFVSASEAFWAAAGTGDEFVSISFDRCVDWLLDLYQATEDSQLRLLITEVLDDLRQLGPVEGAFEDVVLGALASVEAAFEIKLAAR